MLQLRYYKIFFALAALVAGLASQASGEKLQSRVSQGNNMQVHVISGACGPFHYDYTATQSKHMFPAGSGNTWGHGAMGFMPCAVSDLNGDGAPEDTVMPPDGRNCYGFLGGPEAVDEIAAIFASGQNTGSIAADINHWRVWSSLDDDDLTDWPVGGRQGRSPGGEIIRHGAETIFTATGDALRTYGYGHPVMYYQENSFYFLNYGESNDMVYVETETFNMSELLKYNATPAYATMGAAMPDGWTWIGAAAYYQLRYFTWGGSSSPWNNLFGYHYAKDIDVTFNTSPTQARWNPPEYALFCIAPLKMPTHTKTGEAMTLTNFNAAGGSFGVSGSLQLALSGKSPAKVYRNIMDTEDFLKGVINPFTGRHHNAWPGKLEPTDTRYNQWVWGGGGPWITDRCYGELHDVAPRESYEFDYVMYFVYPAIIPFTPPPLDAANIDAQVIQQGLAPAERYAEVARIVYNGGYMLPETPQPPALTIIPGDRQVSITWGDINVNTPDHYYYFLQDNELDHDGRYKEYDFEGYRVYRSFVGPNDTHSELLADFNRTTRNLQFHYVDKLDDDYPLRRMRNGMKVWYAVVPYDKNYDVVSGTSFSLPLPESAKTWNRPGESIYTVVPRSNASDFKCAGLDGEAIFHPFAGSDPVFLTQYQLRGNGNGTLAEAPIYLKPIANFEFEPVNPERITSPKTLHVDVTSNLRGFGTANNQSEAVFKLTEGSTPVQESPTGIVRARNGAFNFSTVFSGPVDDDGISYALSASFDYMSNGDFRSKIFKTFDTGGYSGANPVLDSNQSGDAWGGGAPPAIPVQFRDGRFTLTWKAGLTLDVVDQTRGYTLPFVEYPDAGYGWGFVTLAAFGNAWTGPGNLYNDMLANKPFSERTAKMVNTLPADNTQEFGIWVNGVLWVMYGTNSVISGMPSAGAVFTVDMAFGTWNSDRTVFFQEPGPPFPGDSWEFRITPTTLNEEDVQISKVRVVPNPYVASSYLDLSPNNRRIEFINLPSRCTIRIYSLGGNLVNVLNHIGASRQGWGNYTDWDRLTDNQPREFTGYDNHSGTEPWNLRNRFGQTVASGLYFFHVTGEGGQAHTGKFYIIN
ncbi:MAG: hypothetical protein V1794_07640 [Candidatus Glassbacteria bacterium]